jgi:hypothetical protein
VLVLDAGDMFLPRPLGMPRALPPDPGELERRARLLVAGFARMGVTALTPGERDLAIGPPLLARLLASAKVPVVSANLAGAGGKLLFPPDRMVTAAGVKIGIFGVTRMMDADAADWKAWGVTARDPVAAAREEIASLRARGAALVVALVHAGTLADAKKLLADAPGADWAVLGHSQMMLEQPETAGSTRMVEAMTQGKWVGWLDLHVVDGGLQFADAGERGQLDAILADHRHQLDDYAKRLTEANQPAMQEFYGKRRREIEEAIARETTRLASLPPAVKGSWFENQVLPLNTSIGDQAGVALLVAAYNRENEARAAAGKPVGVYERSAGAPAPPTPAKLVGKPPAGAPTAYAGSAACGACHQAALAAWRTTKHAHALEALARKKRDRDPTCVGCHVTGFLQPGGTADIAIATTRLRDVGCESCHGPGIAHVTAANDARKTTTARKVPASVCLGCHTPDQTAGDFDYATFMRAVIAPGHGA